MIVNLKLRENEEKAYYSVVIPVFNEEGNIRPFVARVKNVLTLHKF